MQELISSLMSKADLDEVGAEKVIGVVKEFLESKLPGPVGEQVSKALDGVEMDDVGDVLDSVKGLFGK